MSSEDWQARLPLAPRPGNECPPFRYEHGLHRTDLANQVRDLQERPEVIGRPAIG